MSKALSTYLGIDETAAAALVAKLERLSGFHCEDNRLLAESSARAKAKIADLKLDPADTTSEELYHSLLARFEKDSQQIAKLVNIGGPKSDSRVKSLISLVGLLDMPREVWVPRRAALKDLLRRQAPKNLMRQKKYRSLESLLKREDIDELLAVIDFTESPSWRRQFYKSFTKLAPADFEIRQARLLPMDRGWGRLQNSHSVTISRAGGSVAIWPESVSSVPRWTGIFLAAIEAIEALRLESFCMMINQTRPDFGRLLAKQMEAGAQAPALIVSLPIAWRNLNYHYGHLHKSAHPHLAEPYMQQIDLHKNSPAGALSSLFPSMRWWSDNDYLGWSPAASPVSLNIADVALNHVNRPSYRRHANQKFRLSFWEELLSRYLHHQGVETFVLSQIDKKISQIKGAQRQKIRKLEPELQLI